MKLVSTSSAVPRCASERLPRLVFYTPCINAHPVNINNPEGIKQQSSRGVEEGQV
jgi:hypothetical protein